MKTKVTVLGESEAVKPELKKIEFVKSINSCGLGNLTSEPRSYNFIELISRDYVSGMDLMFAFSDSNRDGIAYLGYFNDGVV